MKKLYHALIFTIITSLMLSACGAGGGTQADNLLDVIKQRGYIMVSTDPNYEPASMVLSILQVMMRQTVGNCGKATVQCLEL